MGAPNRDPVVDLKTGLVSPNWLTYFSSLGNGGGASSGFSNVTINRTFIGGVASNSFDVVVDASSLAGDTLAPNVLYSSLTSVGALTSGSIGSGFAANLTAMTLTGNLPWANLPSGAGIWTASPTVTGPVAITAYIGSTVYASQTTGWRITADGTAEMRTIFTDQLHAKAFVADLEQALAGGQIISKSVAILAAAFTAPGSLTPPVLDFASTDSTTGATSRTWSHTCAGSDRLLMVTVATASVAVSSITFNGDALTLLQVQTEGTGPTRVEVWYLKAPDVATGNIVVTMASSAAFRAGGTSFTGVHQTTTFGTTVTSSGFDNTPTVNAASAASELVYDAVSVRTSLTTISVGAGQTAHHNGYSGAATLPIGAASTEIGAATTTMSWAVDDATSKRWVIIAVPLKPAASAGTGTLTVEDLPNAPGMAVFESGDTVSLRSFSRASGGLTIADCVGVVTGYADGPNGVQTWTFTRNAGANGGTLSAGSVIEAKSIVLDFGVTGNGYYEVNAIDGTYGVNSPYAQIVTWVTSPVAANRTIRARFGKLTGLTGTANEYGIIAGTYAATGGTFFRASNTTFALHGIDILLWDGSTNTVKIDHLTPSIALGSPVPTAYGTGTGIWMGKDTTYKFRVGDPTGDRLTYDGNLTLVSSTVSIDSTGITVTPAANDTWAPTNGYKFTITDTNVGVLGWSAAAEIGIRQQAYWVGTYAARKKAYAVLEAKSFPTTGAVKIAYVSCTAGGASDESKVTIVADTITLLPGTGIAVAISGTFTASVGGTSGCVAGYAGINTFNIRNSLAGTTYGARCTVGTDADANLLTLDAFSSTYTPGGAALASGCRIAANGVGGLSIDSAGSGTEIRFYTVGTQRARFDTNGDFVPGTDNTRNCGVGASRWALVRGVTITSGDLAFENGFTFTEAEKVGIAEPGIALLNPAGEVVAFFGATSTRGKGLSGQADVDDLRYVKTTAAERGEMDYAPEMRVKSENGETKTAADVRPFPLPSTGKTNKERRV